MITLEEKFDGHIILYCKNHYSVKDVDFLVGLRRIWAVRCGLSVEHINKKFDEHIANKLYTIIKTIQPKKIEDVNAILHKDLSDSWHWQGREELTSIERVICIYKDIIWRVQIRERPTLSSNWGILIKLPKPQKRLFKRIVSGKGQYNDYNLVKG